MSSIDHRSRASAVAGVGIVAALALGACSGANTSSTGQGSAGGSAPGVSAPQGGEAGSGAKGASPQAAPGAAPGTAPGTAPGAAPGTAKDAGTAKPPGVTPAETQKLARTAHIRLSVTDVTASAAAVRGVALGAGGMVTAEDVSSSEPRPPEPQPGASTWTWRSASVAPRRDSGTVTFAVPAAQLDAVLDQLVKLGAVVQRTSSSQDVTSTYVDAQSRIGTMKSSIDRLRALMTQTTGIDQIVRLETELSQREADLEALQATLATLDKKVTMSTVVVTLLPPGTATTAPEETGFLAGVRSGWTAFTGFLVGLATLVGAVLPFAATLAVLALPAVIWWRRRAGGRRASRVAPTEPGAEPQPVRKERESRATEPQGQAAASPGSESSTVEAPVAEGSVKESPISGAER